VWCTLVYVFSNIVFYSAAPIYWFLELHSTSILESVPTASGFPKTFSSPHLWIRVPESSAFFPRALSVTVTAATKPVFLLFTFLHSKNISNTSFIICTQLFSARIFKLLRSPEPEFVNLLKSPGIDSQPGGWHRFLGSLNVYKFGLRNIFQGIDSASQCSLAESIPGFLKFFLKFCLRIKTAV
jgi:hypothetical protein